MILIFIELLAEFVQAVTQPFVGCPIESLFLLSVTHISLLAISGLQIGSYRALVFADLLLCCGHLFMA